MDPNLTKQLENDFDSKIENLLDGKNHFVLNNHNYDFLSYNQHPLAINCVGKSLLVRSSDKKLLEELEIEYSDYPAEWFMETQSLMKLQNILKNYDMTIINMVPIMVPSRNFKKIESPYKFTRIKEEDFLKFKGIAKFAFSFDTGIWKDRLALAYYDDDKLIAIAGSNQNSKYLWEIGVEKFDNNPKYKNLTSDLVNNLVSIARDENPEVTVIYSTQFSHVKSMNVAVRASYDFAFTVVDADKLKGAVAK